MPDIENSVFAEALAKLSLEDQQRAWRDLICYGTSMIEVKKDGTARLLNPMDVLIATETFPNIQTVGDTLPEKEKS